MNGFRTSAIRADLQNKTEYAETSNWFRYSVIFASVVFFVMTTIFWFDIILEMFDWGSFIVFMIFLGYVFTLLFPILIYTFGYVHAKNVEYNRTTDVTHLVGSIAGQLSMNSGQLGDGFIKAVTIGREMEQEAGYREEKVSQKSKFDISGMDSLE